MARLAPARNVSRLTRSSSPCLSYRAAARSSRSVTWRMTLVILPA